MPEAERERPLQCKALQGSSAKGLQPEAQNILEILDFTETRPFSEFQSLR